MAVKIREEWLGSLNLWKFVFVVTMDCYCNFDFFDNVGMLRSKEYCRWKLDALVFLRQFFYFYHAHSV